MKIAIVGLGGSYADYISARVASQEFDEVWKTEVAHAGDSLDMKDFKIKGPQYRMETQDLGQATADFTATGQSPGREWS